jgi:CubicO group peptidase (beta-lactamase class C family)
MYGKLLANILGLPQNIVFAVQVIKGGSMNTKNSTWPYMARSALVIYLRIALIIILAFLCMGSKQPETIRAKSSSTATPESQGMDSNDLIGLLDWIDTEQLDVHSIIVMRHSKIVMEVYYPPFTPDDMQMQFSGTKSFLSALFGIAVGEGTIKGVETPFLEYFEDVPVANMSEWKQKITLLNLLNMTSGLEMCSDYMDDEPDAVQSSLDMPMHFEPGTEFEYNPCNSILLGAILEKSTGMKLLDYGMKKLFKPLGIKDVHWDMYSNGYTQSNVGLTLKPEDMLKFGMLYKQDGVWHGKSIIPAEWMAATYTMNDFGYGYQWWQGFDGIGAAGYSGQRIFIFPKQDIIIVVTAAVLEEWHGDNIAVTPLFAIRSDEPLPESPASAILAKRIHAIEHPQEQAVPPLPKMAKSIDGRTIRLDSNALGWKTAELEFKKGRASLTVATNTNPHEKKYDIGLDGLYRGTPRKAVDVPIVLEPPQRYNLNPYEFNFLLGVPIKGTTWMKGVWTDANTFAITIQDSIDFDRDTLTFQFNLPNTSIDWYSMREASTQMTFQGKIK